MEEQPEENRLLAFLKDDVTVDLGRLTRHVFSSSSCGICGKSTLEAIFNAFPPITNPPEIHPELILAAPGQMRTAQSAFDSTGGLHAAALFDEIDLTNSFLLVSGRVSFEIMQKSLAVRIPIVAAISAPSSLAVEFAENSGQTLIGFLRPPNYD